MYLKMGHAMECGLTHRRDTIKTGMTGLSLTHYDGQIYVMDNVLHIQVWGET